MSEKKIRVVIICIILIFIFGVIAYLYRQAIIPYFFQPTSTSVQAANSPINSTPEIIAENLTVPWELVFLPNGDQLITERSGNLQRFGSIKKTVTIPGVTQIGEGGLMGMALDPEFELNHFLYLYMTTEKKGKLINEIVRYTYDEQGDLSNRTIIFSGIPAARFHNGGRIKFGPDGFLYITTGDALSRSLAQDKNSLAGKILRITKEGQSAPGNPFNSPVYSYGHRNPQGIAWDDRGQLWETEHGESAHDELNLIKPGSNYGWPIIQGNETADGMVTPVRTSGAHETWAPGGIAYINGSLFFGGLRGQTLYEAKISDAGNNIQSLTGHFREQFGRIRNVVAGPDGKLYFMTSNRDGRGWPAKEDDRIIRISTVAFSKTNGR